MTDQYSNYLAALANRDQQLTLIAAIAIGYVLLWFVVNAAPIPERIRKILIITFVVTLSAAMIVSLISAVVLPWRTA